MNDNSDKEIFGKEKEIDLKDMCFYIFKKWRGLLIGAVVAAVLLTAYKIPSIIELRAVLSILQKIVKYIAIGIVIGIIIMFIVYVISYIINGKIKSEDEFKLNCRLNILGVLPKKNGKKLNGIDRLVRRMFGIDRCSEEFQNLAVRLAVDMKAVLSAKSSENDSEKATLSISVVSTEPVETATEIVELLCSKINAEAHLTIAGNVLKSAESIRVVMDSDIVLLVERIASSRYRLVEETCEKLAVWGKPLLGIVFLDGEVR
ncbi:MAG: hypothetical protein HDT13_02540 [Butyrivibrio sp.]|nr:hypothetical protein [Butyrivibrio sp.]